MRALPLVLALTLLAACKSLAGGGAAIPRWVDHPDEHPGCERALYLCGVGSAAGQDERARALSYERALDAVVGSIQVEVQSVIELDATTHRENNEVFWAEELVESIRITTRPEDLPGVEVVELWRAPRRNETYALVSVRRDLMLERYMPAVEQALGQAEQYLDEAARLGDADPGAALRQTLAAYEVLSDSYAQASRAAVIATPAPFGGPARSAFAHTSGLLADASSDLARLASRLRISKVAGDGQAGSVHGELAAPLVARFELEDGSGGRQPLVDFPVAFIPRTPGAAILSQQATTTDARGQVSASASDLRGSGTGNGEILVLADFTRLAPSLSLEHLPRESFSYSVPTPAQTRLVVAVSESFDGRPLSGGVLTETLADHLSARGFDTRTGEALGLAPSQLAGLSPAALRQQLGDSVDYVIRGTAQARVSSQAQGLVWFRAAGELQVVDLATGQSQTVALSEVKQAHTTVGEAGALRALKALKTPLRARIDEVFVSSFLPEVAAPRD